MEEVRENGEKKKGGRAKAGEKSRLSVCFVFFSFNIGFFRRLIFMLDSNLQLRIQNIITT